MIAAHDHFYERFTPIDADGRPSPIGIRQFIVGTGGAPLTPGGASRQGSEAWASVWGVWRLTLRPDSYQWAFLTAPPASVVADQGSGVCR